MATRSASRRGQPRYAVTIDQGASVAFEHPDMPGRRYELPLADLSVSGISFTVAGDDRPPLDTGATIPGATIRIGEVEIRGELVVMHVTREAGSASTCGALFYPESDSDLLKLKSLLAGMRAVTGS